jgi:hypothetical protein
MLKILLRFIIGILFADGHGENAEVCKENRCAYFSINIADIIVPVLSSEVKLSAEIYGEQNGRGAVYLGYNLIVHKCENYKRDS